MNDSIERTISMMILDLQNELFHQAQSRQMFLIQSSREAWEKALTFYQTNHQQQIDKILNCVILF